MSGQDTAQLRDALGYVPPNDRDTWLRMGMAVKSELGEDGFALWDEWSQAAGESYDERDSKSVWRSIRPVGKVTIGTLFHEAKRRGWTGNGANGNRVSLTDAERAQFEQQRRLEEVASAKRRQSAQREATEIWNSSKPAPDAHAYLTRKGVKPHGARVYGGDRIIGGMTCDGALLVPVRDATGELCSLEFIDAQGEKRFLPGGRKSGGYFSIGQPSGVIVVAEGFATGASVYEAAGHATAVAFDKGNLLPVAQALRDKYPDARIIIAADDDYQTAGNPGMVAANKAAAAVDGLVAVPSFGADREGAKDFNDMMLIMGADAVRVAVESAAQPTGAGPEAAHVSSVEVTSSTHRLPEPEPLRRPLPPATPYPIDALGPVLSAAARRIHEVVQAPAALCGQSILAAASLAAQAHADVVVDGRRDPLSLFVMTIAESGERKSAADRVALEAHRVHERAALDQYGADMQMYSVAFQAHEAASRATAKGKKVGEIRSALEDLGPPPTAPANPILLVPTPTLEGIHKLYTTGRPSIGLFHDDAGEFIGGHAMNAENRMKSAAGLSRLWDSGEFDRVRAGDGAQKHFGRRLSMHLMIQPVIAETVLSDDILTGQGLLARALLSWPESTIGRRPYVETDLGADPDLARYRRNVSALLEREPTLRAGSTNELQPRSLVLTPEAKRVWIAVHDAIETDQQDGGEFATVRAWASKSPAQVLRIAGVLTLIEVPDAGVIKPETIERAALLMEHHLREAARIVGTASVPAEIRHAEALRDWCHREQRTHVYSRAAMQYGPSCIRTVATFDAAIQVLERSGWAMKVEGGCYLDEAMRKRVWIVRGAT